MIKTPKNLPKLPEVKITKKDFKRRESRLEKRDEEFTENVVQVDRVSRVVAGGKRMRFRATVVVGNKNGKVGLGVDKANDVVSAVKKAVREAKNNLITVPIKNDTIPHEIFETYGSAKVLLKPAAQGTGIIAGGPVRVVAELAGIKNILSKILGSNNKINNLKAVLIALKKLTPQEARIKEKNETRYNQSDDKKTK
jgi:small subunit ribosomal protein S5